MANPIIRDTEGREIRLQLTGKKDGFDLYGGNWTPITKKRSKPVIVGYRPAMHRTLDATNSKRLFARMKQLEPKLKS